MKQTKMIEAFEAVYHDDEPGERLGGWEVVQWTWVKLDGTAKSGQKYAAYYDSEESCKAEAARLNKMVAEIAI